MARTFQSPALFAGLTVLENVMTGRYLHGRGGMVAGMLRLPSVVNDEIKQRERVEEILELLEIAQLRHHSVTDLPYGLQKRVELGRALAQDPKILFLDEPMAGMTVDEKEDMSAFILASRDALANTVVLIEHDMGVVMDLAEHVVVLDFGRKIGDGTPAEIRGNEAVITAYLGADSASDEAVAEALEEAR
jgi:branched-chain amino acid transport system ATP-binding protein